MSNRLPAFKIAHDAKWTGKSWGDWHALAALDREAQKALDHLMPSIARFKQYGDSTPEEATSYYFTKVAGWTDPKSPNFCLSEALPPSKPDASLCFEDRLLKEIRRWFAARRPGYVPIGTEPKAESHLATWRREVRQWFSRPHAPAVNLNPEPAATDVERWSQYGRLLELDAAAAEKWRAECLGRNRTR